MDGIVAVKQHPGTPGEIAPVVDEGVLEVPGVHQGAEDGDDGIAQRPDEWGVAVGVVVRHGLG